jgi:hypothetical protein
VHVRRLGCPLACCGAFADERRIAAGDDGVWMYSRACASLVASFAAAVRELALERIAALHTGALIATFYRDAHARCGAFVDEQRIVGNNGRAGRVNKKGAAGILPNPTRAQRVKL